MTSQETGRPARRSHGEDDVEQDSSNRAVRICLTVGIGLFLLILLFPYLNDL